VPNRDVMGFVDTTEFEPLVKYQFPDVYVQYQYFCRESTLLLVVSWDR